MEGQVRKKSEVRKEDPETENCEMIFILDE